MNILKNNTQLRSAIKDIKYSFAGNRFWVYLSWQETKLKYRRSFLGPFWITISTGIMVGIMGPLYSYLFKQNYENYINYLAISLVLWAFISNYINDVSQAYIISENYIKQLKLPYFTYILKVMTKNLIILLHNLIIVLIVITITDFSVKKIQIMFLFGFLITILNLLWIGLFLAILCARYRDIPPIVSSLLQVAFFITPILWDVNMLGDKQFIAQWNPLFHSIDLIRSPFLGIPINENSWFICVILFAIGSLISFIIFTKYRKKISYFL